MSVEADAVGGELDQGNAPRPRQSLGMLHHRLADALPSHIRPRMDAFKARPASPPKGKALLEDQLIGGQNLFAACPAQHHVDVRFGSSQNRFEGSAIVLRIAALVVLPCADGTGVDDGENIRQMLRARLFDTKSVHHLISTCKRPEPWSGAWKLQKPESTGYSMPILALSRSFTACGLALPLDSFIT